MEKKLSHLDAGGNVHMVDVGGKPATMRVAVAQGRIVMKPETLKIALAGDAKKGDVRAAAQIAGVMAAKKTWDLIPLCHPLPLSGIDVKITPDEAASAFVVRVQVRTTGPTGVEMEALTAVSVACLTLYDMLKAVDKGMTIEAIQLLEKSGGASGDFVRPQP
jgi:cyclic pyranopterin phosphate synthase